MHGVNASMFCAIRSSTNLPWLIFAAFCARPAVADSCLAVASGGAREHLPRSEVEKSMLRNPHFGCTPRVLAECSIVFALVSPSYASDPHPTAGEAVEVVSGIDRRRSSKPTIGTFFDADEVWRLASTASPTRAERQVDGEIILVGFALTAPDSIDDDIAKLHDLVKVKRMVMPSLDLRVVSYRIRSESSVTSVLDRLRADHRISSAQADVAYRAVEEPTRLPSVEHSSRLSIAGSLAPRMKKSMTLNPTAHRAVSPHGIPLSRLSAARLKCVDVQRSPGDYELDLVELCRAL